MQILGYVLDEPITPGGHAVPDGFEALWHPHRAHALAVLAELCAAPAHPLVHLGCLEAVRTTLYDVVGTVATEGAEAGMEGGPWPPLVQIQEKRQALSEDRGLSRFAREFYRELAKLAEERIHDARDADEEAHRWT